MYGTVGMSSRGETVEVNFGQEPFMFDILQHQIAQRRKAKLEDNVW